MEQRKLAFRAWDKVKKEMNYKVLVGNTDIDGENYTCNLIWDNEKKEWVNADHICIDLMQFTGLIDRNGNEIYEGDIILLNDEWNNRNTPYSTYLVNIKEVLSLSFICQSQEKKSFYGVGYEVPLGYWVFKHFEVIGNMYSNPELLAPIK